MQRKTSRVPHLMFAALLTWSTAAAPQSGVAQSGVPQSDAPGEENIAAAAGALKQAALQVNFASDARQLALLQQAQDHLGQALPRLDGERRTQTEDLLDDVRESVAASGRQLGTLSAPDANRFGPMAPGRNQLAQLAVEAQQLQRHEAQPRRLITTVTVRPAPPPKAAETLPPGVPPTTTGTETRAPPSSPLSVDAAWHQIRIPVPF